MTRTQPVRCLLTLSALAVMLAALPVVAAPKTWYVDSWTLSDGATARGSFVYDAETGQVAERQDPGRRGIAAEPALSRSPRQRTPGSLLQLRADSAGFRRHGSPRAAGRGRDRADRRRRHPRIRLDRARGDVWRPGLLRHRRRPPAHPGARDRAGAVLLRRAVDPGRRDLQRRRNGAREFPAHERADVQGVACHHHAGLRRGRGALRRRGPIGAFRRNRHVLDRSRAARPDG